MVSVEEPESEPVAPVALRLLFQTTPFLVMVHDFTLLALHEMAVEPPESTRFGEALRERTGIVTVTVADAGSEIPSGPVQVIEYVEVTEGVTVMLPEVAPPVENPPAAVQLVASVEDQVSVEDWPLLIVFGEAVSEAVGIEGAITVMVTDCNAEVPPGPVHWNVNVVSEVRGSVRPLPFRLSPVGGVRLDQGPPAVQLVAPVEAHVSVDRSPEATEIGEAVSEVVGTVAFTCVVNDTSLPYAVPALLVA
jgi:hypothetical protein